MSLHLHKIGDSDMRKNHLKSVFFLFAILVSTSFLTAWGDLNSENFSNTSKNIEEKRITISDSSELSKILSKVEDLKAEGGLPDGGIEIVLKAKTYNISNTLIFKETHSGEENKPIIIKSEDGHRAKISGGIEIKGLKKLSNEPGIEMIKNEVVDKIYCVDLKEYGITSVPPLELGGFGSQRVRNPDRSYANYRTFPCPELFFNGEPMTIARFPNTGFINVDKVIGEIVSENPHYKLLKDVKLKVRDCPLDKWAKENNILLHGYWQFDWADSYESVESINPENQEIKLKYSSSAYGYREGARFYALNLLCELDSPGEWYLDRNTLILYFYPPAPIEGATIELSLFESPAFVFDKAKYVSLENIDFSLFAGNIVQVFDGEHIKIAGCSFTKSGGYGITIDKGKSHIVQSCDFVHLGKGGVYLRGGDRKNLDRSEHKVDNCYFSDLARIDRTYNPAVYAYGVGHTISHNYVKNNPSSAFRVDGNDITVEFNEVCNVLLESDDQGALDTWGNPTYRGLVIRYNYWHHIGNWNKEGLKMQGSVRLDDAISGVYIYGNIFYKGSAYNGFFGAVQIHGGKDNLIKNNIFAECSVGISCTPWPKQHWEDFVKGVLENQDVDMDLYYTRYPELQKLNENINLNTATNNIFWKCDKLIIRAPSVFVMQDNLETTDDNLFPNASNGIFALDENIISSLNIKFEPIPFEKIGLYIDEYRKSLPCDIITKMRIQ